MSEQERNVEQVKKGLEAFSTGDGKTMMSFFDDNIEWIQPGESAISGTYHGKAELGQFFSRLAEKSATIRPHRFLADGDTVVVLCETTAGGETNEVAQVLTLRDGKTVRLQVYADTAAMERVFGRKQVATG